MKHSKTIWWTVLVLVQFVCMNLIYPEKLTFSVCFLLTTLGIIWIGDRISN